MKILISLLLSCLIIILTTQKSFSESTMNAEFTAFMQELEKQARQDDSSFTGFDTKRGKAIFFEEHINKTNEKTSCSTCHTSNLKQKGKTTAGKVIEPLAPSVNKKRLTSIKDIEKWLKRNFRQVFGREGTPKEKGDVLSFIISQ